MKTIGVLGSSGKIGAYICEGLLGKGYQVVGGQRGDNISLKGHKNFLLKNVEIFDDDKLKKFCKANDIIINSAGPSYIFKDRIQRVAEQYNKIFIDLSEYLMHAKKRKNFSKNINIIGAGCIPGLLGTIINTILNTEFDEIKEIVGIQNYNIPCSFNSFKDIILSSYINGLSGVQVHDGQIKVNDISSSALRRIPQHLNPLYLNAFLSDEIIDICKKYEIKNLKWYVARENLLGLNNFISQTNDIADIIHSDKIEMIYKKILEDFKEVDDKKLCIYIDCKGKKNHTYIRKNYVINIRDLEYVSSLHVINLISKISKVEFTNGLYWAKDLLIYDDIKEINNIYGKDIIFSYEINYENESIEKLTYEEGIL